MELNTFGAALKFAMDLENHAIRVYSEVAQYIEHDKTKDTFLALAATNEKRKAMLERLYNENVFSDMDTGVFEPIAGLKEIDYFFDAKSTNEMKYPGILTVVMLLEEKTKRFYLDLAAQIKFRRGAVSNFFGKLAQENQDRILKLNSF